MLGRDLVDVLTEAGEDVTGYTRQELDITDASAVAEAVKGYHVVINAAAYTNVDGAETDEAQATAVNGHAVAGVAAACADAGARLIQISTDYVFDGTATEPYDEDAPTAPINAYGRSKLIGEQAVLKLLPLTGYVVRTAWLYGAYGRNFVTTMLRLATQRQTIDVVDDQRGQPTWSRALARQIRALARSGMAGYAPAGVYHGTASGSTTWYGLARAVFAEAGLDPDRIRPIPSTAYPRPARRPAYSVLGHNRWIGTKVPPAADWRAMLSEAMAYPAFQQAIREASHTPRDAAEATSESERTPQTQGTPRLTSSTDTSATPASEEG